MPIRELMTIPNPVLRKKAHPVTKFDDALQGLIDDMIDTMRVAQGVGLAAPQVGVSLNVIVIEYTTNEDDETASKKLHVVINPEIKTASDEKEPGVEGCLSLPGLLGEVERSLVVTVKGQNRHGKPYRIKAQGWLARIFQHEIDHLQGVVFTDRANRIWKPEADEEIVDSV
jgi:peptide deformylase